MGVHRDQARCARSRSPGRARSSASPERTSTASSIPSTRTFVSYSRSRPTSTCTSTARRSTSRLTRRLIAAVTQREGLLPLDAPAVARVVEEGMRLAEDQQQALDPLRRPHGHRAERRPTGRASRATEVIRRTTSSKSIRERVYRVNLIEEHVRESMERGIIVVDTEGAAIGQVNGLSVIDLGDTVFGQPSRHHGEHRRRARRRPRPAARGAAGGADPHQGRADAAGLPGGPLRRRAAADPDRAPLLRAELRHGRRRQRHLRRDLRPALAPGRRPAEAVATRSPARWTSGARCRRSAA